MNDDKFSQLAAKGFYGRAAARLSRKLKEVTERAEKAESRQAEAVALLREARDWIYCATRFEQANRLRGKINAHLAACDKAPTQESGETATRKCPACGDPVLHRLSPGLGWIPIQYHDCKMENQ